jgi:hypothetical protein
VALIAFPAAFLAVHAYHITLVQPLASLVTAASCGMTAAVPAYFYAMSLPQASSFPKLMHVSRRSRQWMFRKASAEIYRCTTWCCNCFHRSAKLLAPF